MKNRTCLLTWTMLVLALTAIQSLAQLIYEPYTFATLAGNSGSGSTNGTGSAARFWHPQGVAADSAHNLYVADQVNHTIRKVTPTGAVTTLAGLVGISGSTDGTGSAARFSHPSGLAVDSAGNVYVADTDNSTIRKVSSAGEVATLAGLAGEHGSADGTGSAARFGRFSCGGFGGCSILGPTSVAVDGAGNVYVADAGNNAIRKVTPAGVVSTLAGLASIVGSADGTGSAARFSGSYRRDQSGWHGAFGVAIDSAGNVYVADGGNNTIRKGYPENVPGVIVTSGPGFGFNGGQFGFNLTGPAGRLVVVEGSADLVSWLPLWTNTFTFPATLNFSDPQSGVYSNRFYRTVSP